MVIQYTKILNLVCNYEWCITMNNDELKHKLRELKSFEKKIRFEGYEAVDGRKYLWFEFFSTKENSNENVKYPLEKLSRMNSDEIKEVFDEFFFDLYYLYYRENGYIFEEFYDPKLLSSLGLKPTSTKTEIKARFRELAKTYHPDHGGDSEMFIGLMETYRKLTGE